ncbi:MAG TPA: hypothetical protein VGU61_17045 [Noviherbaspirillum sp.]|jgi:hypothetical protein|uniref:hypothetical protein n=1 Tax=Noviherbaspirillum sp. TaxID=1926288 RepID=UPI002DDD0444|nr:hypothetical protein [Noviherbaspirillum sp.]HEV2611976.1 hypothetical protein [Noviherbaspirillum sp.]
MKVLPVKEIQNENSRSSDVDASCNVGWPVSGIHGAVVTGFTLLLSFNCNAG